MIYNGGRFTVLNDGVTYANLTITDVVKNDTGVYVCKDMNFNSFELELTVYKERDVVISPEEPEFIEGQDLLLNCTVDGITDQTVTWSVEKAGTPEDLTGGDDTTHVQVFNNGSLIVRALTPEDAGVYICTHEFDEASKSAIVNVTVSPTESQVSPTVSPTESPAGGAVTFSMGLWRFLGPLFLFYALLN